MCLPFKTRDGRPCHCMLSVSHPRDQCTPLDITRVLNVLATYKSMTKRISILKRLNDRLRVTCNGLVDLNASLRTFLLV